MCFQRVKKTLSTLSRETCSKENTHYEICPTVISEFSRECYSSKILVTSIKKCLGTILSHTMFYKIFAMKHRKIKRKRRRDLKTVYQLVYNDCELQIKYDQKQEVLAWYFGMKSGHGQGIGGKFQEQIKTFQLYSQAIMPFVVCAWYWKHLYYQCFTFKGVNKIYYNIKFLTMIAFEGKSCCCFFFFILLFPISCPISCELLDLGVTFIYICLSSCQELSILLSSKGRIDNW